MTATDRRFPSAVRSRSRNGAAGPASEPRPQAVGEDNAGQDRAEREAAAHVADLLQR